MLPWLSPEKLEVAGPTGWSGDIPIGANKSLKTKNLGTLLLFRKGNCWSTLNGSWASLSPEMLNKVWGEALS